MAYRDEVEALEERELRLRERLREIDAQLARQQELVTEAATLQRALGEVEGALNAVTAREEERLSALATRLSLPVLHQMRVASPCRVPWKDMEGDAGFIASASATLSRSLRCTSTCAPSSPR